MPAENNVSVRVRMYRQGLGDCFLLTFRRADKPDVNMLIDCGLLQHTRDETDIMRAVAENVVRECGGTIDAVVMTHEHWDHISGFSQAQAIFDTSRFERVWVGWTENDAHPVSARLKERFRKQLQGLHAANERIKEMGAAASEGLQNLRETIDPLVNDFFGAEMFGAARMGRSATWQYVMDRSANTPKYCEPGTVETLEGLDGVRFYILGPPADFETFTQTEPKKDQKGDSYRHANSLTFADSFFAAVTPADDLTFCTETSQPFDSEMRIPLADAKANPFFDEFYYSETTNRENIFRNIDDDWLMALGGLALNIDSYTNNTCLAFAVELVESGKMLVFPGDAQFGNWLSWQGLKWEITGKNGEKQTIQIKDIFDKTVFYKVGHHGSHNATLREHGLEMMNNNELVAMIPVNRKQAESQTSKTNPKGWEMPEAHLFTRLKEKTKGRVIIADEADKVDLEQRCKDFHLPESEAGGFLGRVVLPADEKPPILGGAPLYVEYTVE